MRIAAWSCVVGWTVHGPPLALRLAAAVPSFLALNDLVAHELCESHLSTQYSENRVNICGQLQQVAHALEMSPVGGELPTYHGATATTKFLFERLQHHCGVLKLQISSVSFAVALSTRTHLERSRW